jgi:hypothetical protein
MPSNQIAFWLASKGVKEVYDKEWDDVLKECGPVVPEDKARQLLQNMGGDLGLDRNKNYGVVPVDHNSDPAVKGCCNGAAKPPAKIFGVGAFRTLPFQIVRGKVVVPWRGGIVWREQVLGRGWNKFPE